jgi:hypothetical protein
MSVKNMIPSPPVSRLRCCGPFDTGKNSVPQCGHTFRVRVVVVIRVGDTGPLVSAVHAPTGFCNVSNFGTTSLLQCRHRSSLALTGKPH